MVFIKVELMIPFRNLKKKNNLKNSSETGITIPYVIINPENGPSDKAEYEYIVQIRKNKEMGIKNLGYITTNEYTKSIKMITSEIDKYIQFYGSDNISGIFIDEISSGVNPLEIDYMAQIYNYIKDKYPDSIVVANPGGTITDEMSKYSDLWLTSEQSADNYINHWTPRTYNFESNPENANRIVHVIHSATPEQYETLLKLSKERNAGFLMIATNVPNIPGNLPQNFKNLIMSINAPRLETLSDVKNSLSEQSIMKNTDVISNFDNLENPISEKIAENITKDDFELQPFISSKKYNINGNLKISSLDLWSLLSSHCETDIFLSYLNVGYNILEEITINPSKEINKFGDFKFDLGKKLDVYSVLNAKVEDSDKAIKSLSLLYPMPIIKGYPENVVKKFFDDNYSVGYGFWYSPFGYITNNLDAKFYTCGNMMVAQNNMITLFTSILLSKDENYNEVIEKSNRIVNSSLKLFDH